jgi:DNA repair ATPase RecN
MYGCQIVEAINRRSVNDQKLVKIEAQLESLHTEISKRIDELQNGIEVIQGDTEHLAVLKNKLMFIEQFYLKKTCFETEIDTKVDRIEQNIENLKKNMDGLIKDLKFVKEQVKYMKNEKKNRSEAKCVWKFWQCGKKIKRHNMYNLQ